MPTQNTDITGNPYAITYTVAGQKWIVAKGIDVLGTDAGVYSEFGESKLINKGAVSGGTFGVLFDLDASTAASTIENVGTANFNGGIFAVYVTNFLGAVDINNDGKMTGGQFGIYASGSSDVGITNSGSATGGQFAIFVAASSAGANGPVIDNSGKAQSAQYGLYVSGPAGIEAKIVNHDGALIKGGLQSLMILSKVNFKNEGKLDGGGFLSSYDDIMTNKGKINGDLLLGLGDDTFKSKGAAKAGLVDTQDGNDLVVFGDKADKLLFDSTLSAVTNVDTLKKFESGKDALYLDDDIFSALSPGVLSTTAFHIGTAADNPDQHIIYDKPSGKLYYDPDGNGTTTQTHFASLDAGTKLKASDFIVGEYSILFT